jgi:hypothetical protein
MFAKHTEMFRKHRGMFGKHAGVFRKYRGMFGKHAGVFRKHRRMFGKHAVCSVGAKLCYELQRIEYEFHPVPCRLTRPRVPYQLKSWEMESLLR